jgi:hypothetical protein
MTRPVLTASQLAALRELESHDGWYDCRLSPAGRHPYRDLVRIGYAEGDGHGKYRITDDGREHTAKRLGRAHPKAGARRRPRKKTETREIRSAVVQRHQFGSTEKILRRNRKTWTRLGNKRRRAVDKKTAKEV